MNLILLSAKLLAKIFSELIDPPTPELNHIKSYREVDL